MSTDDARALVAGVDRGTPSERAVIVPILVRAVSPPLDRALQVPGGCVDVPRHGAPAAIAAIAATGIESGDVIGISIARIPRQFSPTSPTVPAAGR